MFRLTICVALLLFIGIGNAQDRPAPVRNERKAGIDPKLDQRVFAPDLAIVGFKGVVEGDNYVFRLTVKNNGPGDYTKGRTVRLSVYDRFGTKELREINVPAIKARQSYTFPLVRLPIGVAPGRNSTVRFHLALNELDLNKENDTKSTLVRSERGQ